MNNLIELKGKIPLVDSRVLAKKFNQEHRFVYRLILSHKKQLERHGVLRFESVKPKTGRPMQISFLTEEQALLLLTYTRATETTDRLRSQLIDNFTKMRKALLMQSVNEQNKQWLTDRDQGKLQRRSTTDVIETFIEYATNQGSQNAKKYFMNISKMENKALFIVNQKYPNLRDIMDNRQLDFIKTADLIVEEAIKEGMETKLFYKDIYKLCKERVVAFSGYVPRSPIPLELEA